MDNKEILMGRLPSAYKDGNAQSITFCVTEECNLRCKYCYMVHKNNFHRMSLETAKKAVDYFLDMEPKEPAVIWEFIGGEPTLEMELIDQISDYIKVQMYVKNHPWFNSYVFSLCTNGILYDTEAVQSYIEKNKAHVSFAITIDGTKEKHDLQRVRLDGSGSYDAVVKNIPLWLKQFPGSTTKVTFASDDLKYLKDSIIHLWDMGLNIIPANVVFEDVWKDGDDQIFEQQLCELADYVINNKIWEDHSVRFFDPTVGFPLGKKAKSHNLCGTGKMIAVDTEGKLYSCLRFIDFCNSQNDAKPPLVAGNITDGLDENIRSIVRSATIDILNDEACAECPVASGCFSCTACNYDYSKTGSVFMRTKFHCLMQKAQVRASEYFWGKLARVVDEVTPRELERMASFDAEGWRLDGARYLYFVTSDSITPHCMYESNSKSDLKMPQSILLDGLDYAHKHSMIPVFLGDPGDTLPDYEARTLHMVIAPPKENQKARSVVEKCIPLLTAADYMVKTDSATCVFRCNSEDIVRLDEIIESLSTQYLRINIVKGDLINWDDATLAEYQHIVAKMHLKYETKNVSINIFDENNFYYDCVAGKNEFALAPNGEFYICPGFYFKEPENSIGNIKTGIDTTELGILNRSKSPKCRDCSVKKCSRCALGGKLENLMLNIPAKMVCESAKIEESERSNQHV